MLFTRNQPGSPLHIVAALAAGAALMAAFAPYGFSIFQILSVAFLFYLVLRANSVRWGFFIAWAYGTGWMTAGVHWLYFSMHQFGGLNRYLAMAAVLALGLFMGLLPALAVGLGVYIRRRWDASDFIAAVLILPALLTLAEWTRGWLFTGLPWAVLGYAHTDSALAGFAPVLGVYGITLVATVLSGSAVMLAKRSTPYRKALCIFVLALTGSGYALAYVNWTEPAESAISVRLLQGNVPQELKFAPDQVDRTLALYREMILAKPADLAVTPETALPVFLHMLDLEWFDGLRQFAVGSNTVLAIGIPIADSVDRYTNSLIAVSPDAKTPHHINYRYDKNHLVPFGEFVPRGFRWFIDLMHIPLGDFTRGPAIQRPFAVKGQWVLPNICYEDIFGEEIAGHIRAAISEGRPEPTIMLNISNIAWFGDSLALPQHLQISRMRSLEMQRPMLRSTNTGITAFVDAKGHVQSQLPAYSASTLEASVQGYRGMTPYIRFGNYPAVFACFFLLLAGIFLARRKARAGF